MVAGPASSRAEGSPPAPLPQYCNATLLHVGAGSAREEALTDSPHKKGDAKVAFLHPAWSYFGLRTYNTRL
jgi:hypothetical protein